MHINQIYTNILQFDIFKEDKFLFDFSTTCGGGYSEGNYSSFNLGEYANDNSQNVIRNRLLLASILEIDLSNLYLPYQTHEDKILCIDEKFLFSSEQEQKEKLHGVDAVITKEKRIVIGVTTADCVPILIFDPKQQIVAAVHAGWRSTVANIATKAIQQMKDAYGCLPQNMKVGIAPAISQEYFEVGEEVVESFIKSGFIIDDIAYKNKQTGKMHINLPLANKIALTSMGILPENIEMSDSCTYSNPEIFFSARRQGIKSGRMVTGAVLL